MKYIVGSLYILKNKLYHMDFFTSVPRIEPKLPWYRQYSWFYYSPTEIINNLYLGSSFNAFDIEELNNKNINTIINVTQEIDNYHQENTNITYHKYPIKDNNLDDITEILENSYQVIDEHLERGDVILVHCYMGASRSASVVIYYLMKKFNLGYESAKTMVCTKRQLVNLSKKFDQTLKDLESSIELGPL